MKNLLFAALVAMLPFFASAQISITGKVTDQNQNTLPGATIKLRNQKTAVVSDASGKYTITNLVSGKYTIVVKYVGYKTIEKAIDLEQNTTLDFSLTAQNFLAEDVIV